MERTIKTFLAKYPEWKLAEHTLTADFKLADFVQVQIVVEELCKLAAELNHHPTVAFGYNTLHVATTTHDAGNTITEKDIELATRVSKLVG